MTRRNPLLPPSHHQEVIAMATTVKFPLCTWVCSNFLKKPPFLAAFSSSWLLIWDWMWRMVNAAWCQQKQPCLTVSYPERKGEKGKEAIQGFWGRLKCFHWIEMLSSLPSSPWISHHCGGTKDSDWTPILSLCSLCQFSRLTISISLKDFLLLIFFIYLLRALYIYWTLG